MIRLVFIDVDGTLHGPDGVPDCAWNAARRARERGLRLSLATGRPGAGISLEYARRLDSEGMHIFHQGALVALASGEPVHTVELPQRPYHMVVDIARKYALPLEAYADLGGIYVERGSLDLDNHERLLDIHFQRADLHRIYSQFRIIRTQFVARPGNTWESARAEVDEAARENLSWHTGISPATPGVIYASLLESGAGKLSAARWVAARLGVAMGETAMIGDGANDIDLIRASGLGIAMGNAKEDVKRAADYVVASAEECGISEALEVLWRVL